MLEPKFSDKQIALMSEVNGENPLILAQGAVRSGKTFSGVEAFLIWSQTEFPDKQFLISGQTFASARRNVLSEMFRLLGWLRIPYRWNKVDAELKVGRATYIVVGANNEASQDRIQGLTLAGAFLDEAVLQPKSFFYQVLARLTFDESKLWCTYNPDSPGHWFKKEVHDGMSPAIYKFGLDDNPSLGERTKERYKEMFSGVFYQRYVLGEWAAAEGIIYPTFVVDFPAESEGRVVTRDISVDYATSSVFSATVYEQYESGVSYAVREDYYDARKQPALTDELLIERTKKLAQGDHIDAIIVDPSAASFKVLGRKHKLPIRDADNDVLPGIRTTGAALAHGRLRITRACKEKLREIEEYRWDPDKQEIGIDKPLKENDHSMDDMRYYAMHRLQQNFRQATAKPAGV